MRFIYNGSIGIGSGEPNRLDKYTPNDTLNFCAHINFSISEEGDEEGVYCFTMIVISKTHIINNMSNIIFFGRCLVVDHFDSRVIENLLRSMIEDHDFFDWDDIINHLKRYAIFEMEENVWGSREFDGDYKSLR